MSQNLDEQLAELERKQNQLEAQRDRLIARSSEKFKKEDTRKKILIGAAILARVKRGLIPEEKLKQILDEELTRPTDRKLFNLPLEDSGED